MTLRISTSKARNGTNSAQAFSGNLTIAGYSLPHASANSKKPSAAVSVLRGCGVGRLECLRDLAPVMPGRSWIPCQAAAQTRYAHSRAKLQTARE